MERDCLKKIFDWNRKAVRKPLVLMGARQVGKTWLMNEFARQAYPRKTVFVNFMAMADLSAAIANTSLTPTNLLALFQAATGQKIITGKTLLVLDEIQECPKALTALKFFHEQLPEQAIMVAGSLLGLSMGHSEKQNSSFPVGQIERLDIHPMTFLEFLSAIGKNGLAEAIKQGDWTTVGLLATEYETALKNYLLIGGMPEAVATFADTNALSEVRAKQLAILSDYDDDFKKHAPIDLLGKIRLLWNNLPAQLAKENKKFIYTALRPGARAREYETALQWLDDAGMVQQIYRVSPPRLPLKSYRDFGAFKLYAHDVGLLAAMSALPIRTVLDGNALFTNFKGALTEQFVLCELSAAGFEPAYWTSDSGTAELDFIIQGETDVVPIEVKAATNTKAKSLSIYRDAFHPVLSVKSSLKPYHAGEGIVNIPLYALGARLQTEIEAAGC